MRNGSLRDGDAPLAGHGTPPAASDAGDAKLRQECTQPLCGIHSYGWSPRLALAVFAREILVNRVRSLRTQLDEAACPSQLPRIAARIQQLSELEKERSRQMKWFTDEM